MLGLKLRLDFEVHNGWEMEIIQNDENRNNIYNLSKLGCSFQRKPKRKKKQLELWYSGEVMDELVWFEQTARSKEMSETRHMTPENPEILYTDNESMIWK